MIGLEKGQFYKKGKKTIIVGEYVPAISNVWICEVTESGILKKVDCLYHRQYEELFEITTPIKIKSIFKEKLQVLFSKGQCVTSMIKDGDFKDWINVRKLRSELPNVDKYLK